VLEHVPQHQRDDEQVHDDERNPGQLAQGDAAGADPEGAQARAQRLHDGRITTDTPDELWATDPTEAWTRLDGRWAVFAIVDHCTGEAWVDAAPRMDRFAAADLLREAIIAQTV